MPDGFFATGLDRRRIFETDSRAARSEGDVYGTGREGEGARKRRGGLEDRGGGPSVGRFASSRGLFERAALRRLSRHGEVERVRRAMAKDARESGAGVEKTR